jgi:hypothetical protein
MPQVALGALLELVDENPDRRDLDIDAIRATCDISRQRGGLNNAEVVKRLGQVGSIGGGILLPPELDFRRRGARFGCRQSTPRPAPIQRAERQAARLRRKSMWCPIASILYN